MTSAQTMLVKTLPVRCAVLALAAALAGLFGCGSFQEKDELTSPRVTQAPYDTSFGEVLWAVVPLSNESGTELVDPLVVSDKIVAAAEEVDGVRTVPLNRTLQAMSSMEMRGVQTPEQVRQLAAAMGVDGIIFGSITAYDPYDPPTIGMSLALYSRTPAAGDGSDDSSIDPRALSASPTETRTPRQPLGDRPTAVVSANLNASDHGVLMALREYAEGRHDPVSALGWRRYTASMDLYTQFAAQHLVAALVAQEHQRLAPVMEETEEDDAP